MMLHTSVTFEESVVKTLERFGSVYQDSPGSIHEDTVMDGHRQGKKSKRL